MAEVEAEAGAPMTFNAICNRLADPAAMYSFVRSVMWYDADTLEYYLFGKGRELIDIDSQERFDQNALGYAINLCSQPGDLGLKVIEQLVTAGADPAIVDARGTSPVGKLLDRNVDDREKWPLEKVEPALELLIRLGACKRCCEAKNDVCSVLIAALAADCRSGLLATRGLSLFRMVAGAMQAAGVAVGTTRLPGGYNLLMCLVLLLVTMPDDESPVAPPVAEEAIRCLVQAFEIPIEARSSDGVSALELAFTSRVFPDLSPRRHSSTSLQVYNQGQDHYLERCEANRNATVKALLANGAHVDLRAFLFGAGATNASGSAEHMDVLFEAVGVTSIPRFLNEAWRPRAASHPWERRRRQELLAQRAAVMALSQATNEEANKPKAERDEARRGKAWDAYMDGLRHLVLHYHSFGVSADMQDSAALVTRALDAREPCPVGPALLDGETALTRAIRLGRVHTVRLLLDKGSHPAPTRRVWLVWPTNTALAAIRQMSRKEAKYGTHGTTLGNLPPDEIARRKEQVRALLVAAAARHRRGATATPDANAHAGSTLPTRTPPPEAGSPGMHHGTDGIAPLRPDTPRTSLGPPPPHLFGALGCCTLVAAVVIATGVAALTIHANYPGALCETNVGDFLVEYGALCIGLGAGVLLVLACLLPLLAPLMCPACVPRGCRDRTTGFLIEWLPGSLACLGCLLGVALAGVCVYAAYLFVVGTIAIFWTHPNAALTDADAPTQVNASRGNATEAAPIDGCDPRLLGDSKTFMIVLYTLWVLTFFLNAACCSLAKPVGAGGRARARDPPSRLVKVKRASSAVSGSV